MLSKQAKARMAAKVLPNGQQMINRPTIVPTVGTEGAPLPVIETDPYFAIEVDTRDLQDPAKVVLFDASRGYQAAHNYTMPLAMAINGKSGATYQFILNDLSHNASYFDIIKMRVISENGNSEELGLIQFANAIEVYESSKGSSPRLIKTIHPDMGIHEGQFKTNINTFTSPTIVTNRTALVYIQEPGIRLVLGFYQKAELGRKQ